MMDNLDKELHRLSKINPPEGFIEASKSRLLNQIMVNPLEENWIESFLTKERFLGPSASFISEARNRLMAQIRDLPQPLRLPLKGLAYALNLLKKTVASTLVMIIAVTAVLFQVEGNTIVEASNDSYLEPNSGTVLIKRKDGQVLEVQQNQTKFQPGDLIQTKQEGQVILHFFDDTQVRLNENTSLLINQLDFSAAFSDQAVIETTLQEGEAWVQTLNIEDGYAGFTMQTPEAVITTLNSSFGISLEKGKENHLQVVNGIVNVSTFSSETGQLIEKTRLSPNKILSLTPSQEGKIYFNESDTDSSSGQNKWVNQNLEKDEAHLNDLRQKEYDRLTLMAGTLPGEMLYPIKRAKELLKLEWTDNNNLSVEIEIANNRLNEAIVLFQRGESDLGQEALNNYQDLAKKMLEVDLPNQEAETLITQLVVPHQKTLALQSTDKNSIKVKETLQKTAEILAQNPLELETIRLKNAVANLKDIASLIEKGEVELAKTKLAKYKPLQFNLDVLEGLKDQRIKKEAYEQVTELGQEEKELLALVSEKTSGLKEADEQLKAMIASASKEVNMTAEEVRLAAMPPPLKSTKEEVLSEQGSQNEATTNIEMTDGLDPESQEAKSIADQINIYSSWTGQYNQIQNLLTKELEDTGKIDFLLKIQTHLEGRAKNYLGTRILQLQNKLALQKMKNSSDPTSVPAPIPPKTEEVAIPDSSSTLEVEIINETAPTPLTEDEATRTITR